MAFVVHIERAWPVRGVKVPLCESRTVEVCGWGGIGTADCKECVIRALKAGMHLDTASLASDLVKANLRRLGLSFDGFLPPGSGTHPSGKAA